MRTPLFTSRRERRLWLALGIVLAAIYATLANAPAIASMLRERGQLTESLFLFSLVSLVLIAIVFVSKRRGRAELAILAGILIVLLMAWIRIGVATPEQRTHLFEYSLVAALVHEALLERRDNGRKVRWLPLLAWIIAVALGCLDEGIQALLPNRVFDPIDILFNTLAATIIIGARWVLALAVQWLGSRRAATVPPAVASGIMGVSMADPKHGASNDWI